MTTPLRIEYNAYEDGRFPHRLTHGDARIAYLTDVQAGELQRLIDLDAVYGAELPDGVRWATVLEPKAACPAEWQRAELSNTWLPSGRNPNRLPVLCRPIPAPATVKVRWQDSIGRHLPDGQKIIGADETTISPRIKYGTPKNASYRLVSDLVEVLAPS